MMCWCAVVMCWCAVYLIHPVKKYFIFDMLVWLSCEVAYQDAACLYMLGIVLCENIHPCLLGICLVLVVQKRL
jgi:hypothetical protein